MFLRKFVGIDKKSTLKVSIVGGSNSVMRRGYTKYLKSYLAQATSKSISLEYYSLGGVPSIYGVIQQARHDIAVQSDIIFFDYRDNDRYAIDARQYGLDLSAKSLEGFIKKVQKSNPKCLIVLILIGTNLDQFYHNPRPVCELYKSIGKQYNLPVIDLTEVLSKDGGLDFVKSLYNEKDHAHYTRPHGVQIVSQAIVDKLDYQGIIKLLKSRKDSFEIPDIPPIAPDNFADLKYFDRFEEGNYFAQQPKISIYQNTVFRERNFTIYRSNSLNFLLKGRLMAILIKSDLNDGFIELEFDSQKIVTSSYNSWVNNIKPQNVINLCALPMHRFKPSTDFTPVSISLCKEYPEKFEIGYNKVVPTKKNPDKWKLSIIGLAYLGEIKPMS